MYDQILNENMYLKLKYTVVKDIFDTNTHINKLQLICNRFIQNFVQIVIFIVICMILCSIMLRFSKNIYSDS